MAQHNRNQLHAVNINFSLKGTTAASKHFDTMVDNMKDKWEKAKLAKQQYLDAHAKDSTPDYDKQVKALDEMVKATKKDLDAAKAMQDKGIKDYQSFIDHITNREGLGPKTLKPMLRALSKSIEGIGDLWDKEGKPIKENQEALQFLTKAYGLVDNQLRQTTKGVLDYTKVLDKESASYVELANAVQQFERGGRTVANSPEHYRDMAQAMLQNRIQMQGVVGEWKQLNAESTATDYQRTIRSWQDMAQWAQKYGADISQNADMMQAFNAMTQRFSTKESWGLISTQEVEQNISALQSMGKQLSLTADQQQMLSRAVQAGQMVQAEKTGRQMEQKALSVYGEQYEHLNKLGDDYVKQESERWKKQMDSVERGTEAWIRYRDIYQHLMDDLSRRKMESAASILGGGDNAMYTEKIEQERARTSTLQAQKESLGLVEQEGQYIYKNAEEERKFAEAVERSNKAGQVSVELEQKRTELQEVKRQYADNHLILESRPITDAMPILTTSRGTTQEFAPKGEDDYLKTKAFLEGQLAEEERKLAQEEERHTQKREQYNNALLKNAQIEADMLVIEEQLTEKEKQMGAVVEEQTTKIAKLKDENRLLGEQMQRNASASVTEDMYRAAKEQLSTGLPADLEKFLGIDVMKLGKEDLERFIQLAGTYKNLVSEQIQNGVFQGEEQKVKSLNEKVESLNASIAQLEQKGTIDPKLTAAISDIEGNGSVMDKAQQKLAALRGNAQEAQEALVKLMEQFAATDKKSVTEQRMRMETGRRKNAAMLYDAEKTRDEKAEFGRIRIKTEIGDLLSLQDQLTSKMKAYMVEEERIAIKEAKRIEEINQLEARYTSLGEKIASNTKLTAQEQDEYDKLSANIDKLSKERAKLETRAENETFLSKNKQAEFDALEQERKELADNIKMLKMYTASKDEQKSALAQAKQERETLANRMNPLYDKQDAGKITAAEQAKLDQLEAREEKLREKISTLNLLVQGNTSQAQINFAEQWVKRQQNATTNNAAALEKYMRIGSKEQLQAILNGTQGSEHLQAVVNAIHEKVKSAQTKLGDKWTGDVEEITMLLHNQNVQKQRIVDKINENENATEKQLREAGYQSLQNLDDTKAKLAEVTKEINLAGESTEKWQQKQKALTEELAQIESNRSKLNSDRAALVSDERLKPLRDEVALLKEQQSQYERGSVEFNKYQSKINELTHQEEQLVGMKRVLTEAEEKELERLRAAKLADEGRVAGLGALAGMESEFGTSAQTAGQAIHSQVTEEERLGKEVAETLKNLEQQAGVEEEVYKHTVKMSDAEKARLAELEGYVSKNEELDRQISSENAKYDQTLGKLDRVEEKISDIAHAKQNLASNKQEQAALQQTVDKLGGNLDQNELAAGRRALNAENKDLIATIGRINDMQDVVMKKGLGGLVKFMPQESQDEYNQLMRNMASLEKMIDDYGSKDSSNKYNQRRQQVEALRQEVENIKQELAGLGSDSKSIDTLADRMTQAQNRMRELAVQTDREIQNAASASSNINFHVGEQAMRDAEQAVKAYENLPKQIQDKTRSKLGENRGFDSMHQEGMQEMMNKFTSAFKDTRYQTDNAFRSAIDAQWKDYLDVLKKTQKFFSSSQSNGMTERKALNQFNKPLEQMGNIGTQVDNIMRGDKVNALAQSLDGVAGAYGRMDRMMSEKHDPFAVLANNLSFVLKRYDEVTRVQGPLQEKMQAMFGTDQTKQILGKDGVARTETIVNPIQRAKEALEQWNAIQERTKANGGIVTETDKANLDAVRQQLKEIARQFQNISTVRMQDLDTPLKEGSKQLRGAITTAAQNAADKVLSGKVAISSSVKADAEEITRIYSAVFQSFKFQSDTAFADKINAQFKADQEAIAAKLQEILNLRTGKVQGLTDDQLSERIAKARTEMDGLIQGSKAFVQNIEKSNDLRTLLEVNIDVAQKMTAQHQQEGQAATASAEQIAEGRKLEQTETEKALAVLKQYQAQKAQGVTDESVESIQSRIDANNREITALQGIIDQHKQAGAEVERLRAQYEALEQQFIYTDSMEAAKGVGFENAWTRRKQSLEEEMQITKNLLEANELNYAETKRLMNEQATLLEKQANLEREIQDIESATSAQKQADQETIQRKENLVSQLKQVNEQLAETTRNIELFERKAMETGKGVDFSKFGIDEIKGAMQTWQEQMRRLYSNDGTLTDENRAKWEKLNEQYQMAAHYLKAVGEAEKVALAKGSISDLDAMYRKRGSLSDASISNMINEYNRFIVTMEHAGEKATKYRKRVEDLQEILSQRKQDTFSESLDKMYQSSERLSDQGLHRLIQQYTQLRDSMETEGKDASDITERLRQLVNMETERKTSGEAVVKSLRDQESHADKLYATLYTLSDSGIKNLISQYTKLRDELGAAGQSTDAITAKMERLNTVMRERQVAGLNKQFDVISSRGGSVALIDSVISEMKKMSLEMEKAGEDATNLNTKIQHLQLKRSERAADDVEQRYANMGLLSPEGLKKLLSDYTAVRNEVALTGLSTKTMDEHLANIKARMDEQVNAQKLAELGMREYNEVVGTTETKIQHQVTDWENVTREVEKVRQVLKDIAVVDLGDTSGFKKQLGSLAKGMPNADKMLSQAVIDRAFRQVEEFGSKHLAGNDSFNQWFANIEHGTKEGLAQMAAGIKEMAATGKITVKEMVDETYKETETTYERVTKIVEETLTGAQTKTRTAYENIKNLSDQALTDQIKHWTDVQKSVERTSEEYERAGKILEILKGESHTRAFANADKVLSSPTAVSNDEYTKAVKVAEEEVRRLKAINDDTWEDVQKKIVEAGQKVKEYKEETAQAQLKQDRANAADVLYMPLAHSTEEYNKALKISEDYMRELKSEGDETWKSIAIDITNAKQEVEKFNMESKKLSMTEQLGTRQVSPLLIGDTTFSNLPSMSDQALKEQLEYWQKMEKAERDNATAVAEYGEKVKAISNQMVENANKDLANKLDWKGFDVRYNKIAESDLIGLTPAQLKEMQQNIQAVLSGTGVNGTAEEFKVANENAKMLENQLAKTKEGYMSIGEAVRIAKAGSVPAEDDRDKYFDRLAKSGIAYTKESLEEAIKVLDEFAKHIDQATDKGRQQFEAFSKVVQGAKKDLQQLNDKQSGKALDDATMGKIQEGLKKGGAAELVQMVKNGDISLGQLRAALKQTKAEIENMDGSQVRGAKAMQEYRDEMAKLTKQSHDLDQATKTVDKSMKYHVSTLENAFDRLKNYVLVYVGFQQMVDAARGFFEENLKLSDSLANVQKVTGLTADEIDTLNNSLLNLHTKSTTDELQSIAYQAGKMGMALDGGAERMAKFVEAAEEVNTALGEEFGGTSSITALTKLGNTLKLNGPNMENAAQTLKATGSAILDLGNSSVASYGFITQFATRVGSVGDAANLSMPEILALGATIDTFGAGAEMSSTAITRLLSQIASQPTKVAQGLHLVGDELNQWNEYAKKGEMMNMLQMMFNHLNQNKASLTDISASMKDLTGTINNQRTKTLLASMANSAETLNRLLAVSRDSFDEALEGEASVTEAFDLMNESGEAAWERIKNGMHEAFVNSTVARWAEDVVRKLMYVVEHWDEFKARIIAGIGGLVVSFNVAGVNIMLTLQKVSASFRATMLGIRAALSSLGWTAIIMAVTEGLAAIIDRMNQVTAAAEKLSKAENDFQGTLGDSIGRINALHNEYDRLNKSQDGTIDKKNKLEKVTRKLQRAFSEYMRPVIELKKQYDSLSKKTNRTAEENKTLKDITSQLNEELGGHIKISQLEIDANGQVSNSVLQQAQAYEVLKKQIEATERARVGARLKAEQQVSSLESMNQHIDDIVKGMQERWNALSEAERKNLVNPEEIGRQMKASAREAVYNGNSKMELPQDYVQFLSKTKDKASTSISKEGVNVLKSGGLLGWVIGSAIQAGGGGKVTNPLEDAANSFKRTWGMGSYLTTGIGNISSGKSWENDNSFARALGLYSNYALSGVADLNTGALANKIALDNIEEIFPTRDEFAALMEDYENSPFYDIKNNKDKGHSKEKAEAKSQYDAYIKEYEAEYERRETELLAMRVKNNKDREEQLRLGLISEKQYQKESYIAAQEYNRRLDELHKKRNDGESRLRNMLIKDSKQYNKEMGDLSEEELKIFKDKGEGIAKTASMIVKFGGDELVDEIMKKAVEERKKIVEDMVKWQDEFEKALNDNNPFRKVIADFTDNAAKLRTIFGANDIKEHTNEEMQVRLSMMQGFSARILTMTKEEFVRELQMTEEFAERSVDEYNIMYEQIMKLRDDYDEAARKQAKKDLKLLENRVDSGEFYADELKKYQRYLLQLEEGGKRETEVYKQVAKAIEILQKRQNMLTADGKTSTWVNRQKAQLESYNRFLKREETIKGLGVNNGIPLGQAKLRAANQELDMAMETYQVRQRGADAALMEVADEIDKAEKELAMAQGNAEKTKVALVRLGELEQKLKAMQVYANELVGDSYDKMLEKQKAMAEAEAEIIAERSKNIKEFQDSFSSAISKYSLANEEAYNAKSMELYELRAKKELGLVSDTARQRFLIIKSNGKYEEKWLTQEEQIKTQIAIDAQNKRAEAIEEALRNMAERLSTTLRDAMTRTMEMKKQETEEEKRQQMLRNVQQNSLNLQMDAEANYSLFIKSELDRRLNYYEQFFDKLHRGAEGGIDVNVNHQNVEGHAKGIIGLHGPGTETSDSIPAMLSRGESVITAEGTKKNRAVLEAINRGETIDFAQHKYATGVVGVGDKDDIIKLPGDMDAEIIPPYNPLVKKFIEFIGRKILQVLTDFKMETPSVSTWPDNLSIQKELIDESNQAFLNNKDFMVNKKWMIVSTFNPMYAEGDSPWVVGHSSVDVFNNVAFDKLEKATLENAHIFHDYTKNFTDKDYNLWLNNCSDASRRALEFLLKERMPRTGMTTPYNVRNYALNRYKDRFVNDNGKRMLIYIPIDEYQFKKISKYKTWINRPGFKLNDANIIHVSELYDKLMSIRGTISDEEFAKNMDILTKDTRKSLWTNIKNVFGINSTTIPDDIIEDIINLYVDLHARQIPRMMLPEIPNRYAKGKVGLKGPGTETSDDIPAMLSRGESVITAEGTKKNREILEAINRGEEFDIIRRGFAGGGVDIDGKKVGVAVVNNEDELVKALNNLSSKLNGNELLNLIQYATASFGSVQTTEFKAIAEKLGTTPEALEAVLQGTLADYAYGFKTSAQEVEQMVKFLGLSTQSLQKIVPIAQQQARTLQEVVVKADPNNIKTVRGNARPIGMVDGSAWAEMFRDAFLSINMDMLVFDAFSKSAKDGFFGPLSDKEAWKTVATGAGLSIANATLSVLGQKTKEWLMKTSVVTASKEQGATKAQRKAANKEQYAALDAKSREKWNERQQTKANLKATASAYGEDTAQYKKAKDADTMAKMEAEYAEEYRRQYKKMTEENDKAMLEARKALKKISGSDEGFAEAQRKYNEALNKSQQPADAMKVAQRTAEVLNEKYKGQTYSDGKAVFNADIAQIEAQQKKLEAQWQQAKQSAANESYKADFETLTGIKMGASSPELAKADEQIAEQKKSNEILGQIANNMGAGTDGSATTGTQSPTPSAPENAETKSDALPVSDDDLAKQQEYADQYVQIWRAAYLAKDESAMRQIENSIDSNAHLTEDTKKQLKLQTTDEKNELKKRSMAEQAKEATTQALSQASAQGSMMLGDAVTEATGSQALGQLTAGLAQAGANALIGIADSSSKTMGELGWWGAALIPVITSTIMALLGSATSKVKKAQSTIASATGASNGKLSTGMLTYAEGRYANDKGLSDFDFDSDFDGYRVGRSYNVHGADGVDYNALFEGRGMATGLRKDEHFGIFSEKKPEMVIDGDTTQKLMRDFPGLYNGILDIAHGKDPMLGLDYDYIQKQLGKISMARTMGIRNTAKGMPTFAEGSYPYAEAEASGTGALSTNGTVHGAEMGGAIGGNRELTSLLLEVLTDLRDNGVHSNISIRSLDKAQKKHDRWKERTGQR